MSTLKDWKFPFPSGDELIYRLEMKRVEYRARLLILLDQPTKPRDLVARFHLEEDETDSDFRLLYLKLFILSMIIEISKTPHPPSKSFAVEGRAITSELAPIFRIYQFPNEFNTACKVIHGYLTGVLKLESNEQIPTSTPEHCTV